jgi:hypothetical protein
VTAQSYVNAINRVLNPVMSSPGAHYLLDIVGADAMQQGIARTASGVRAAGDQLIVRLKKRVRDFAARTTMPYFCPVQKDLPIASEGVGGRRVARSRARGTATLAGSSRRYARTARDAAAAHRRRRGRGDALRLPRPLPHPPHVRGRQV